MVGESDQAHTEGIALGSLRIFTEANGPPMDCNTCAARFENPQCEWNTVSPAVSACAGVMHLRSIACIGLGI
jgi:hypothetical protein